MASGQTGYFEIVNSNISVPFTTASNYDMVIRTDAKSQRMFIGTGSSNIPVILLSSNLMGVNTVSPVSTLHIASNALAGNAVVLTLQNTAGGTSAGTSLDFVTSNTTFPQARIQVVESNFSGHVIFHTKSPGSDVNALVEHMRLTADGRVGLKTTTPGYELEVSGNIYASSYILAMSDRRYKTDLVSLSNCVDNIAKLNGYSYLRSDEVNSNKRHIGLIAQQVESVYPELVLHDSINDRYSINYGSMAAVFVESIKELKDEIAQLKQEIAELKSA